VSAPLFRTGGEQVAFDQLARLVASGEAVALVGAGVSAGLGYPNWRALLDGLHDRIVHEVERAARAGEPARQAPSRYLRDFDDLLWRAEEYRRLLGPVAYAAALEQEFGAARALNETIRRIVRLPFRHLLTTNYDTSLERAHAEEFGAPPGVIAWDDEAELLEFLFEFREGRARRCVYLHGRVGRPDGIVLSDEDYTTRYVRQDDAQKRLFALFAMQRVVFVGFSLSDPDLMAILRQVNASMGLGTRARHFALMGVDGSVDREVHRNRLQRKFGIAPVFYDSANGHAQLDDVLRRLEAQAPRWRGGHDAPQPNQVTPTPAAPSTSGPRRRPPAPPAAVTGVAPAVASPAERPPLAPLPAITVRDDPQQGRFGGRASDGARELVATVRAGGRGWFAVQLLVRPVGGSAPITGTARFHLHDTFHPDRVDVAATGGVVRLDLEAYGAFTVGVELPDERRRLELDLASLADAPLEFRMN
jgi:NAD-dependent SIR2 family protein deacetylase